MTVSCANAKCRGALWILVCNSEGKCEVEAVDEATEVARAAAAAGIAAVARHDSPCHVRPAGEDRT